jgi:hypothetical protein
MSKYAKNTKHTKHTKPNKEVKNTSIIEKEPTKSEAEEMGIKLANKIFTQLSFKPDYHFISKITTTYIFYKFYRNPDYVKYQDGFKVQLNVIRHYMEKTTSEYDKIHFANFISYIDEKKSIELLFLNLLNYSKNDSENFTKMMKGYLYNLIYNKFIFQYISKALLYLVSVNPNPTKERQCIQYGELIDLSINYVTQELFPTLLNIKNTKKFYDDSISEIFKSCKTKFLNKTILDEFQKKYDTMNLEELRNQASIINTECYKLSTYDQIAFKTEGFAYSLYNNFSKNIQTLLYIRNRKKIVKQQLAEEELKSQKCDFKIKVCDCYKNYPKN